MHLPALALALLRVLPQVPHVPLQAVRLRPAPTAYWKVGTHSQIFLDNLLGTIMLNTCRSQSSFFWWVVTEHVWRILKANYHIFFSQQAHLTLHAQCLVSFPSKAKNISPGDTSRLFGLFTLLMIVNFINQDKKFKEALCSFGGNSNSEFVKFTKLMR